MGIARGTIWRRFISARAGTPRPMPPAHRGVRSGVPSLGSAPAPQRRRRVVGLPGLEPGGRAKPALVRRQALKDGLGSPIRQNTGAITRILANAATPKPRLEEA